MVQSCNDDCDRHATWLHNVSATPSIGSSSSPQQLRLEHHAVFTSTVTFVEELFCCFASVGAIALSREKMCHSSVKRVDAFVDFFTTIVVRNGYADFVFPAQRTASCGQPFVLRAADISHSLTPSRRGVNACSDRCPLAAVKRIEGLSASAEQSQKNSSTTN